MNEANAIDLISDEEDNYEVPVNQPPPVKEDEDEPSDDEEEYDDTCIRILMLGDPIPKPSVRRTSRGCGFYNPAAKDMKAFRAAAEEQISNEDKQPDFLFTGFPVFPAGVGVVARIWFCKRPPNTFFINGDRTRPKHNALFSPCIVKPDTDNCVKFVLDALSKLVWEDDNQVHHIVATKIYDNEPPFEGRTIVELRPDNTRRCETLDAPYWAWVSYLTWVSLLVI